MIRMICDKVREFLIALGVVRHEDHEPFYEGYNEVSDYVPEALDEEPLDPPGPVPRPIIVVSDVYQQLTVEDEEGD